MASLKIETASPDSTRALGRRVGELCKGGECLLLHGSLGAGKTCFVQGLAAGLGVPSGEPVVSPTFVLHAQYRGKLELNHFDAYRLNGARDLGNLGFQEFLSDPKGVAAVEWAEFLAPQLPARRLVVNIAMLGDKGRSFEFTVHPEDDKHYKTLLTKLGKAVNG